MYKVGDKVRVVKTGWGCGDEHLGREVTIIETGGYNGEVGCKVSPAIGNSLTGVYDGFIGGKTFELVKPAYPNPPHKHAELIKAWADGAEIQYFNNKEWVDKKSPNWWEDNTYRIKPSEPTPKELAEQQLKELEAKVEELKATIQNLD